MSAKATHYVWENSKQSGSALLMLLAIADAANDDGTAEVSNANLAKKARVDVRNVRRMIKKLEGEGELSVGIQVGKKTPSGYTNRYTIIGVALSPSLDAKGGAKLSSHEGAESPSLDAKDEKPPVQGGAESPSNNIYNNNTKRAQKPRKPKDEFQPLWNKHRITAESLLTVMGYDLKLLEADRMSKASRQAYLDVAIDMDECAFDRADIPALHAWVKAKAERERWTVKPTVKTLGKYVEDFRQTKVKSGLRVIKSQPTQPLVSDSERFNQSLLDDYFQEGSA